MAGRLAGKAALLTAAAAGIGRATAEAFAREGARVIATDIDVAGLEGLDADTRKLDVRSNEAVEALAREIGPIDILFNCAGFVHHGTVLTTSDADWDFSFDLNVKSMHRTIRAFLPGMLEKGSGLDRQHRLRRLLGARHPQPLRLRRLEGRGDRPHQVGRGRLHPQGRALQRHLPRHDREPVARRPDRDLEQDERRADRRRCARPSSTASRWAGSASPRRSPRSPSTSPPTRAPSPPARAFIVDGGFAM